MKNRLLERDWRFILDSIYLLYKMDSLDSFKRSSLEFLSSLIQADQSMFFETSQDTSRTVIFKSCVSRGEEPKFMDEFLSGTFNDDPYFRRWGFFPKTTTFRDTDMMPEYYRLNTKIFREIYSRQGIYYGLRSYLVQDSKAIGNICLFNHKERGDFSEDDVNLLDLVAPHITLKFAWLLQEAEKGQEDAVLDRKLLEYGLTQRERELAKLILSGADDEEVADKLCISRATFHKHISNIYRKIGVRSRVQFFSLFAPSSSSCS